MTDDKAIEAATRAMCKADGTAQCAAICLSHFSISTTGGQCPEATRVWRHKARAALAAVDKIRAEGFDFTRKPREPITEFALRAFAAGLAKGEAERAALVKVLEAVELTPGGFINFKRSIPRTQYGALNLGSSGLVRSAIEGWFEERDAALALVRKGE